MCERYSLTSELSELMKRYQVRSNKGMYARRFNISPTQNVAVIAENREERYLQEFRWGLYPFWAKDSINADCRKIHDKPIFERLLKKQRCIIPCSGFYAWKTQGKIRQPMHVVLRNREVFAFAGMYDVWITPQGEEVRTCTILTTKPNAVVSAYQDRMPVILQEKDIDAWLSPEYTNTASLEWMLQPTGEHLMETYPVTTLVNNTEHEQPDCVEVYPSGWALIKE
ncbi:SOS response-associated peptidase [Paenibacillus gansuensis]|uniref:Abasic site processing protein n=1 Tax=Paenibacillus gansuensis TaxID=306542 RepID=A0ABW5PD75_9BACL